ncbi:MAG TPA: hypothetical protein PKY25_00035 [Bacilli bacterium]|nr:hypothetical protein [Bacilli bacterium]
MDSGFIKKIKEINIEYIELRLNYLDLNNLYYREKSIKAEILLRESRRVLCKYLEMLPYMIYVEEMHTFKEFNRGRINTKYILEKYQHLVKDIPEHIITDKYSIQNICYHVVYLNDKYNSHNCLSQKEIDKAYSILFKGRIREDKKKIKKALKINIYKKAN